MIYFIEAVGAGLVKIGFTDREVNDRLRELQTASPHKLRLAAWMEGNLKDEQALHEQFGHLREQGEWFRRDDELVALIVLTRIIDLKLKPLIERDDYLDRRADGAAIRLHRMEERIDGIAARLDKLNHRTEAMEMDVNSCGSLTDGGVSRTTFRQDVYTNIRIVNRLREQVRELEAEMESLDGEVACHTFRGFPIDKGD